MSLTDTPSRAARSRSMVTRTCGASKDRLFCTTMNMPDCIALARISSAISTTRSGPWIDWITMAMGRPPPAPGREGGAKTKLCRPGVPFRMP